MLTNGSSPVFLAHVRQATKSYDDFQLVTSLFKLLDLTGQFVTIEGIRCWIEDRGTDAPIRVLVPCDMPSDIECFKDYLRVTAHTPEEATDAFLWLFENVGDVLDAIYAGHGWKPVQNLSWS